MNKWGLLVGFLAPAGCLDHAAGQSPMTLDSGSYTTPAATSQAAALCPTGQGYPAEWTWNLVNSIHHAGSATSGTPRIEQYRAGVLLATYTTFSDQPGCIYKADGTDNLNPAPAAASGCGPFTRVHSYRLWQPGDLFKVYPAVYSGLYDNPWFGPEYDDYSDYMNGIFHDPDNITIEGVVQNGKRPVILLNGGVADNALGQGPMYFDKSNGMTIENLDVLATAGASTGKAGIYEDGGSNLTLRRMRISGFEVASANGIFGAGNYSGTLTLDQLELDHNGGGGGPEHNAYIGTSAVDPNFTVLMENSWSHDAVYGHLFKSRAQVNVFTGNYFQGGVPQPGQTMAETYLLDVPNGGLLTVRNNVFAKNASGISSNGMSVTFAMEGLIDSRPLNIDIENNTFVTFAKTFDGSHNNYPFGFFYPNVVPGSSGFPANVPTRVIKNAFVGYCTMAGADAINYRGDNIDLTESFAETSLAYTFSTKVVTNDTALAKTYPNYVPVIGTTAYGSQTQKGVSRATTVIGAED